MVHEDIQSGRRHRQHDVKPVRCPGFEPLLDCVCDLLRRTGAGPVAAAASEPADELPHCRPLPPGKVHDQGVSALGAALDRVLGRKVLGQLGIQRQGFRRDPQDSASCFHACSGWMSSSSCRSSRRASCSVEPMTGTMPGRILMLSGSRPAAAVFRFRSE